MLAEEAGMSPEEIKKAQDEMMEALQQAQSPSHPIVRALNKTGKMLFGTRCTNCAGLRGMLIVVVIWIITEFL